MRVTGRVQGVGFRWHAQQEAGRRGVAGWVRNEPDGSVVAVFEGDDDDVSALVDWCRQGPSSAVVRDVAVIDAAPTGADSFDVRY